MSRAAIESMVLDIEAAKTFLLQRNNEGKLNIEQLGVLGTGFGATLALIWAVGDWNVRNLPTYKMGQDVKAVILVSPHAVVQGRDGQRGVESPRHSGPVVGPDRGRTTGRATLRGRQADFQGVSAVASRRGRPGDALLRSGHVPCRART